ncbi:MAG: hypothetical protein AAF483_03280 [Planctomycetota bacterium]
MSSNFSDAICSVLICENEDAEEFPFATGFPVNQHRIVTAAHVFDSVEEKIKGSASEGYECEFLIEIEFPSASQQEDAEPNQAKLIWFGPRDFQHETQAERATDVAVLEFDVPPEITPLSNLLSEFPTQKCNWESHGFPGDLCARKSLTGVESTGASGTCETAPQGTENLALNVETPKLDSIKWKGMSGAPVVIDGSQLLGVLHDVYDSGGSLLATPLKLLLEDKGFEEAVGFDKRFIESVREFAHETLIDLLSNLDSDVREKIGDFVGCGQKPEELAPQLLRNDPERDIIAFLVGIVVKGGNETASIGDSIQSIVEIILTNYFPDGAMVECKRKMEDKSRPIIGELVSTAHGVEAFVSALERRAARFRLAGGKIMGAAAIDFNQMSITDPKHRSFAILKQIIHETEFTRTLEESFDLAANPEKQFKPLCKAFSEALEQYKLMGLDTPYCIMRLAGSEANKNRKALTEIAENVEGMIFMELTDNRTRPELARLEARLLTPLQVLAKQFEEK